MEKRKVAEGSLKREKEATLRILRIKRRRKSAKGKEPGMEGVVVRKWSDDYYMKVSVWTLILTMHLLYLKTVS